MPTTGDATCPSSVTVVNVDADDHTLRRLLDRWIDEAHRLDYAVDRVEEQDATVREVAR